MNSTILNRSFEHPADGWYMIEPKGDHLNKQSNVVQVIDASAVETIVNRFNADAEAGQLSHGREMLIDHEHFKHDTEKETRAYGWLQKLANRDDGIYGQIRWSNTGKTAVDGGDYRFFSTEYDPSDLKVLNTGKTKRVRPLKLDGLTLTNEPNNKGGKPITNRNEQFRREDSSADNTNNQRKQMKSVCTLLGLSADASEEAVLAEVNKLRNRATTAETELTPVKNRVTTLEAENTTLLADQIDADFATAGIKDAKIINRHKPLLSDPKHFKNREERLAFIKDLGKPAAGSSDQTKLLNRDTKPPGAAAAEEDNGQPSQADSVKIMNRAHAIRKDMPGTSLATAVRMAQNEAAIEK